MDKTLGGTCVNVGCIPSKALLDVVGALRVRATARGEHGIDARRSVTLDLRRCSSGRTTSWRRTRAGSSSCSGRTRSRGRRGRGTLKPGKVGRGRRGAPPEEQYHVVQAEERHHCHWLRTHRAPISQVRRGARPLERRRAEDLAEVPSTSSSSAAASSASSSAPCGADSARKSPSSSCCPRFLPGTDDESSRRRTRRLPQAGTRHPHRHARHRRRAATATRAHRCREGRQDGDARGRSTCSSSVGRKPSLSAASTPRRSVSTLGKRGEILVDDQMRTNLPNVYAIGDALAGCCSRTRPKKRASIAAEVIAGQNVAHALHLDSGGGVHVAGGRCRWA